MSWFADFSLRKKLIVIQLVTTLAGLTLYGIFTVTNETRLQHDALVRKSETMARMIATNCLSSLDFMDTVAAKEVLSSARADEDVVNAWIYDAQGKLFATYSSPDSPEFEYPQRPEGLFRQEKGFLTVSNEITKQGERVGVVSLRLNVRQQRLILFQSMVYAAVAVVLGMGLAFLLSILLQQAISNPIHKLVTVVRNISDTGDYTVRIHNPRKDEIGDLCNGFDEMLQKIQQRETERDQAEDTLRKSKDDMRRMRAYLQNIVDSMPSVLVAVDPDGTVTHWNREAVHFTGLTEAESMGRPLGDVLPLLQEHLEKVCTVIREGGALENERFSVRASGHDPKHYDLVVFPLVANGAQGAVVRLDDVTTRVQIEEMMVQTEKMMSVGGLAAGMAHEINNPLGGILQACQNIERRFSADLPKNAETAREVGTDLEVLRQYLDKRGIFEFVAGIRSDGMRAAAIVADMLAFSRRSESQMTRVDIRDLLETVLRLAANDYDLKKQYDFRNVNIVRDFQPELPQIECDKTKIEQVLLNLVKNAAQALAGGEKKNPSTITFHVAREPHFLRIEVADNGPGMPEEIRRRVFEPFFTTKEVGVGTGLGLSVSYFIITKQHKGTLSVESSPGEGARFIIRLPLAAEE